jgi:hypothetical protein
MDLRIDNVDDTVGDENIRDDDLGLVDVDSAVVNGNVKLLAIGSSESTVLESAAVAKSVVYDVVREDISEITLAGVGEDGTDVGKGTVVGNKDGDVPLTAEVGQNLGFCEGTSSGGKVGGDGSIGDVLGDAENAVDDVNDTTGEVEVLKSVSKRSML